MFKHHRVIQKRPDSTYAKSHRMEYQQNCNKNEKDKRDQISSAYQKRRKSAAEQLISRTDIE